MKPYEKPKLIALSLSGNEQLCGYCSSQKYSTLLDEPDLMVFLDLMYGTAKDGTFTRAEFDAANIFGTADDNCGNKVSGYEHYCKFTAADSSSLLAWS